MSYGQHPLSFINALLLCAIAGIFLADKVPVPIMAVTLSAGVFLILSVYCTAIKSKYTFIAIGLLFFLLGAYRSISYNVIAPDSIIHLTGQQKTITGTIRAEPVIKKDDNGTFLIRYEVTAETAKGEPVSGGFYLHARQKNIPEAQIGDKVTAFGKIYAITSYKNPGRIDNTLLAKQQGIFAYMSAGKSGIKIEKQPDSQILMKKIAQIRADIKASMEKVMPKADAAAVFAMLFGGYADIDPDLLDSFTITGIVHILSVSGSHITLLAGSVIAIGRLLRLKKRLIFFILTVIIIIYSIFSGLVPPVIRSAAMGILSYAALTFDRESQSRYLLSVVAVFMLLLSPGLLFNISFQLSFAATAGLLYAAPFLKKLLSRLPEFLSLPLSITLGAQLFCLPFLAWYFHTLSLSSLIANIVAVPIIDIIIIAALAAVIINTIFPFVSSVVFVLCSLMLGAVHEITKVLSHMPGSTVYIPHMTFAGSIVYYIFWAAVLNNYSRRLLYRTIKAHWLICTGFLCLFITVATYNTTKAHDLSLHFIDVGQGDAALIITPHHQAVMIDTGGIRESDYDIGKNVDIPYLYHYGVTRLDYIFLSHSHDDHAGGLSGVINKVPADNIFIGKEKRSDYAAVWHISPQSAIMDKVITLNDNQSIVVDGVRFEVLSTGASSAGGTNETSVVIKLTYKNFSALFTGDLPAGEEARLIEQNGGKLACTVLKVAHHGSKTSSTKEFLEKAQPRWAVISVAANNSYGHPGKEVLDRLQDVKATICRTDQNGAIVFSTDGQTCRVEKYKE